MLVLKVNGMFHACSELGSETLCGMDILNDTIQILGNDRSLKACLEITELCPECREQLGIMLGQITLKSEASIINPTDKLLKELGYETQTDN